MICIIVIKSKRMRWAIHAAHMCATRKIKKLNEKRKLRDFLGYPCIGRWVVSKWMLKVLKCGDVEWIRLA